MLPADSVVLSKPGYICINCLRAVSSRSLTTTTRNDSNHLPKLTKVPTTPRFDRPLSRHLSQSARSAQNSSVAAIIPLTHRRLIEVKGRDTPKFLQGLTTQNVDPSRRDGWYTGFLNAQGRVLFDCFVYPTLRDGQDWSGLIEVDGKMAKALAGHLKRHKLRSKVSIRLIDDGEWNIWASWGHDHSGEGHSVLNAVDGIKMPDPRAPDFGQRMVLSHASSQKLADSLSSSDIGEGSLSSYTIRRYLHGIAEGPDEILPESSLPMEYNMDYMHGIDFRKGCYVGQELTIRTKHTGVVRKRILPIQMYPAEVEPPTLLTYAPHDTAIQAQDIPSGADMKKVVEEGERSGRAVGKFIAGTGNIGLGLCRLEMMTDVKVAADGGGSYKDGDKFAVAWTTDQGTNQEKRSVNVKAFVPEWHLQMAEELRPPRHDG